MITPGHRSQSETVGVVLLTAVVVVVVLTASVVLFPQVLAGSDTPQFSIDTEATTQTVTIWHTGGDTLDREDVWVVIQTSGDREQYDLDSFSMVRGDDNTTFAPGDKWERDHGLDADRIQILVIHEPTNTVVRETVDVEESLAARFDWNVTNPTTSSIIKFDGSDSQDVDGEIVEYRWDFGDGTPLQNSSTPTSTHSYDDPGTYDVSLTVETDDGRTASRTQEVKIFALTPSASFTFTPNNPDRGEQIEFNGSVSEPGEDNGNIIEYRWDFDDNTTKTTDSPTVNHSFDTYGTYDVTLTVEDDNNETAQTTQTVEVQPAMFIVSALEAPGSVTQGKTIEVNATVENTGTETGTQDVLYNFSGDTKDTAADVTLDPGENTTVALNWTVPYDQTPTTYTHGIYSDNDSATAAITVENVSGEVSVQSKIQQNDSSFTVNTSSFENLDSQDGGYLVVENNDTNDKMTVENVGETTTTITSFDLSDGDEIIATLYPESGSTDGSAVLDTDTTFVEAANLTVDPFTVADYTEDETIVVSTNVTESDGIETANLTVTLTITDSGGTVVYTNTTEPGDISNETVAVTFDGVGPLNPKRYNATVTADADNAESDAHTDEFEVIGTGPDLSDVEATSILPNIAEEVQIQTFRFTLDTDLASNETVKISLDEADDPSKVGYGNVNGATVVEGNGSASFNENVITYSLGSNDEQAGTAVEIQLVGVTTGKLGDQDGPYTVTFNRTDESATVNVTFAVARDSGDSQLRDISATHLWNTTGQEQNISFTPTSALDSGDKVFIELSGAEAGIVTYTDVSTADGSIDFSKDGDEAYVIYTAPPGGVSADTQVNVTLTADVTVDSNETYDIGLSRGDADTISGSFNVTTDGAAPVVTPINPEDGDIVTDEEQVINVTISDTDSGVDESTISVTVENDGNQPFGGDGTGTDGIDFNGNTLTIDISEQGETYSNGAVNVTVEVDDKVGNTRTAKWNFTVGDPAFFDVQIDDVDDEVTEGEEITVSYTVKNTGDTNGTQDVVFRVDNVAQDRQTYQLEPGDTDTGTFTYTTMDGDAPDISVEVKSKNDTAMETVTVNEPAFFEVTDVDPDDPVTEGEQLDVEITVENTGDVAGEQTVALEVDADQTGTFVQEGSQTLNLSAGESDTVQLTYVTESGTPRPAGDAPEVDVRGVTANDTRTESARVELAPGPVSFEAEDVGTGATSQQFTFNVDDLDNKEEAVIDLSEPQSAGGIDYSGGTVQVISGPAPRDLTYDEVNDQIIYTGQGNPSGTVTIEISGIDVLGNPMDFHLIEYSDDTNDDADYFEITGEFFDVSISDTNEPIVAGETLTVDAEITNTGKESGTQGIALDIDGSTEDSSTLTLSPGETQTVTLEWSTAESEDGTYTATVTSANTSASQAVTVEEVKQTDLKFEIGGQESTTSIEPGNSVGYTVTAIYNNGSRIDVTDEVTVTSNDSSVLSVNTAANEVAGESKGAATVTANDGEFVDTVEVTVANVDFSVESTVFPASTNQSEDITDEVTVELSNGGSDRGTEDVELRLGSNLDGTEGEDYAVIATKSVTLDAGETAEVGFTGITIPADQTTGGQAIGVYVADDSDTNSITINELVTLQLSANETDIIEGKTVEFTVTNGSGDPVENADVEVTADDGSTETVLSTDADGTATYTFDTADNYTAVAGKPKTGQTVYQNSGEVTVTVSQPMADRVTFVSGTASQTSTGVVQFDLDNAGDEDAEIESIRIMSTTNNNADIVDNGGNNEFSGAGGSLDVGELTVGASTTTTLDSLATFSTQSTFTLQVFRKSNNNKAVDMSKNNKNQFTIEIVFSDGSSDTYVISNIS